MDINRKTAYLVLVDVESKSQMHRDLFGNWYTEFWKTS